jgi:hypothetical protein
VTVRAITDLLRSLGYEPDEEFNALRGHKQLSFWDPQNGRPFEFRERVHLSQDVGARPRGGPANPLPADSSSPSSRWSSEREGAERRLRLLLDQPISVEGIDPERITEGFGQRDRVLRSSQEVREILEEAPKSVPWRLRSIVGKRMRRYELPEETGA